MQDTTTTTPRRRLRGDVVPYGWRRTDDPVWLEPDEAEQQTIRRAVELVEGGMSYRQAADQLTQEGRLPRGGGQWWHPQVRRLLDYVAVAEEGS